MNHYQIPRLALLATLSAACFAQAAPPQAAELTQLLQSIDAWRSTESEATAQKLQRSVLAEISKALEAPDRGDLLLKEIAIRLSLTPQPAPSAARTIFLVQFVCEKRDDIAKSPAYSALTEELHKLIGSSDRSVRRNAMIALASLGGRSAEIVSDQIAREFRETVKQLGAIPASEQMVTPRKETQPAFAALSLLTRALIRLAAHDDGAGLAALRSALLEKSLSLDLRRFLLDGVLREPQRTLNLELAFGNFFASLISEQNLAPELRDPAIRSLTATSQALVKRLKEEKLSKDELVAIRNSSTKWTALAGRDKSLGEAIKDLAAALKKPAK